MINCVIDRHRTPARRGWKLRDRHIFRCVACTSDCPLERLIEWQGRPGPIIVQAPLNRSGLSHGARRYRLAEPKHRDDQQSHTGQKTRGGAHDLERHHEPAGHAARQGRRADLRRSGTRPIRQDHPLRTMNGVPNTLTCHIQITQFKAIIPQRGATKPRLIETMAT